MPTRIDGALFEAARAAGEVQSRSAAQQIDHWARIGREFESAPAVTLDAVEAVLSGRQSYDSLDDDAQAVVRIDWEDRIAARIAGLDLASEFAADGASWAEADEEGALIIGNAADPA